MALAKYGAFVLFGEGFADEIPRFACTECHSFSIGGQGDQGPNLHGVTKRLQFWMEVSKPSKINGPDQPKRRDAYPGAGVPSTSLEFLIESIICHSCYQLTGWSKVYGNPFNDGRYPAINDLVAVITWLYTSGEDPPPPPQAIINAYRKVVPPVFWQRLIASPEKALRIETLEVLDQLGAAYPEDYLPVSSGDGVETQSLLNEGEKLLFGGMGRQREPDAIGKATCATCHTFYKGDPAKGAPNLHDIVQRSTERISNPQFQAETQQIRRQRNIGQSTGVLAPQTVLDYLVESTVCHNCFVLSSYRKASSSKPSTKGYSTESIYQEIQPLSIIETGVVILWIYANATGPDEPLPSLSEIVRSYETFLPPSELAKLVRMDSERATKFQ